MKPIIDVLIGDVKTTQNNVILKSDSIGSCVVIIAYDHINHIGSMCHIMLPGRAYESCNDSKNKFSEHAIETIIADFKSFGSQLNNINAYLFGGANVLQRPDDSIGKDNITSIQRLLTQHHISIINQYVGGIQRRSVELDVESGYIYLREGDGEKQMISHSTPIEIYNQKRIHDVDVTKEKRMDNKDYDLEYQSMGEVLKRKEQDLDDTRKALLNIAQDLEVKQNQLEDSQKATLNIMEDLVAAKTEIEIWNNTLADKVDEKTKELRELTVQLVQSEKLSTIGEISAGILHEFSQPMNTISIISQTLLKEMQKEPLNTEQMNTDVKLIISQISKMTEIMNYMRRYTRKTDACQLAYLDINAAIEGTFLFLGQQLYNNNIVLEKELSPTIPLIKGNQIRLEQVFINFVNNAVYALKQSTNPTKTITIKTYALDELSIVVDVIDNGIGIPKSMIDKIFNSFFTTKAEGKGTGLGLSISKKIIAEHNGRIEVYSEENKGSTFRIILPCLTS